MNLFSPTTRCWIFESSLRRARWNFLSHPSIRPILNRFARKGVYNTMFSEPVLGTRGHETLNLDARLATKPTSPYATNFYASCIYQAHLSPLLQLIARTIINRFEIYNRFFLDQSGDRGESISVRSRRCDRFERKKEDLSRVIKINRLRAIRKMNEFEISPDVKENNSAILNFIPPRLKPRTKVRLSRFHPFDENRANLDGRNIDACIGQDFTRSPRLSVIRHGPATVVVELV